MEKVVAVIATVITLLTPMNASAVEYEVLKEDSFSSEANKHYTSVETLLNIDDLESDINYPKQTLESYKNYLVVKGDTCIESRRNMRFQLTN